MEPFQSSRSDVQACARHYDVPTLIHCISPCYQGRAAWLHRNRDDQRKRFGSW